MTNMRLNDRALRETMERYGAIPTDWGHFLGDLRELHGKDAELRIRQRKALRKVLSKYVALTFDDVLIDVIMDAVRVTLNEGD